MDTERADEQKLIRAAASGDMGAFSELVSAYRMRVLRTAAGLLGSTEEAEDVAQQVFIRVWQHLGDYDPGGSFASWLYRITTNLCIDTLRRDKHEAPLDEETRGGGRSDLEDRIQRQDEREQLRAAIARLPDKTRAALILREYEQLSYKEIAQVLRIPIGTVMSRLNYARRALGQLLQSEGSEPRATP